MKKIIIVISLVAVPVLSKAQVATTTANTPGVSDLIKWLGTQQAQVGTSIAYNGVKYAATWWDMASFGQSGLNVGLASALDYLDFGPGTALANEEQTRYGAAVPIHLGNIWNSVTTSMPSKVASHVHLTALPNVTFCPFFLYPQDGVLKHFTWKKDLQGAIGYRFGGAATTATSN